MRKILFYLTVLLFTMYSSVLHASVYANISLDLSSRYVFRGMMPAGPRPAATVNAALYFSSYDIHVSQWYVNSIGDLSAFHESGTMLSYYHYFNDRFVASGGLTAYIYPGRSDDNFGLEFTLSFSDLKCRIPYYIETHYDPVLGSLYGKISGGYNADWFLPFHFAMGTGVNLLTYTRFGKTVPAGFSDISIDAATFLSLNNWQLTPKLSYIIPLKTAIHDKTVLQAGVSIAYAF